MSPAGATAAIPAETAQPLPPPAAAASGDTGLDALLAPRSIAIVGATGDASLIRGRILEYLLQRNYGGKLFLVSSSQPEIRGRRTHAALKDIGEPVDLVLIAVRADATEAALRDSIAIGARAAICFSSGFAEEGAEGKAMQRRIEALVKESGLRVIGPNSAGLLNVAAGIPATFARNVDLRREVAASKRTAGGKVAIIAQSGGLAFAMHDRCLSEHGLRFSHVVATGNEVGLDVVDLLDHTLADNGSQVLLLLVEGIKATWRLSDLSRRAHQARKPIVVAKFGRTAAGSRAATSHAARLTGSDAAYDAAFARYGMIRAEDEEEMTDLAAAFACAKLPRGGRVGILTTSGGAGVWMADACESAGLDVPELDETTQEALRRHIPSFGSALNPVDMTAQVSVNPNATGAGSSVLVNVIEVMAASPSLDALVLCANMSDGNLLGRERDGLARLAARLKKPLFLYSHATPSPASLGVAQELGLVCFASTRRLARALRAMVAYGDFLERSEERTETVPQAVAAWTKDELVEGVCEYAAKDVLRRHGLPVPDGTLATSADEAVAAARTVGYPVALKIQSSRIPHKTEIGGVILGSADEVAVRAAFDTLMERGLRAAPTFAIAGVLVQAMLAPAREIALGIVRDRDFGPMMMVGLGGIHVEVLKDVTLEPLPVSRDTARRMLRRLRGWPILAGVRGEAPADIEGVAGTMEKLSDFVLAHGAGIDEIDLNPVFVYRQGEGVAIVDAVVSGTGEQPDEG